MLFSFLLSLYGFRVHRFPSNPSIIGIYRDYIGIMKKKMETTIGFRVCVVPKIRAFRAVIMGLALSFYILLGFVQFTKLGFRLGTPKTLKGRNIDYNQEGPIILRTTHILDLKPYIDSRCLGFRI